MRANIISIDVKNSFVVIVVCEWFKIKNCCHANYFQWKHSLLLSVERNVDRKERNNIIVPKWKSIVVRNWNFNPFHGKITKTYRPHWEKMFFLIFQTLKSWVGGESLVQRYFDLCWRWSLRSHLNYLPHHLSKQPFSSNVFKETYFCLLIKLQICKFLRCNLTNFSQKVANQCFERKLHCLTDHVL